MTNDFSYDPFFNNYIISKNSNAKKYIFYEKNGLQYLNTNKNEIKIIPRFVCTADNETAIRFHRHYFFEMILVASGNGIYCERKKENVLNSGDMLFINHLREHFIKSADKKFSYANIWFSPDILDPIFNLGSETKSYQYYRLLELFCRNDQNDNNVLSLKEQSFGRILAVFLQMNHQFITSRIYKLNEFVIHLTSLLYIINQEFSSTIHENDKSDFEKITEYIKKNIDNKIKIKEIADALDISQAALSIKFNKVLGISMPQYINNLRIERAKHLLLNSSMTIVRIAYLTGFNDQAYFNNTFKKI